MLSYGYDPGNPALDERLEAKPRDEDKEYMELFYTYQALLEEVRRLNDEAEQVRRRDSEEPPRTSYYAGALKVTLDPVSTARIAESLRVSHGATR